MADYDIGVLALVVPATSGPKATYRPAVSVRNNGIHVALATGYLRIYAAGLLVFETELYSATLAAGATGNAQAVDYWTPAAEGFYTIHAYLSTPLDQVESNNMLAPVTVEITSAAPPTPPVVTAHAAQHEEGATDEISIDGLQGRTADPQSPLAHAAQHQAGGSDAMNVGSLFGVLAQDQPAQVHSNTRHNPVLTTAAELTAHAGSTAVHTVATNLANRETTGPLTGLVPSAQLQLGTALPEEGDDEAAMGLRFDREMGYVNAAHHSYKHGPTGPDPSAIGITNGEFTLVPPLAGDIARIGIPEAWLTDDLVILLQVYGHLLLNPGGSLSLHLMSGAASWCSLLVPGLGTTEHDCAITAHIICMPADKYSGALEYRDYLAFDGSARNIIAVKDADVSIPASDKVFTIRAEILGGVADYLIARSSFSRSLGSAPLSV